MQFTPGASTGPNHPGLCACQVLPPRGQTIGAIAVEPPGPITEPLSQV